MVVLITKPIRRQTLLKVTTKMVLPFVGFAYILQTECAIPRLPLHDPVDSQSQLECIGPPVARATTFMVTLYCSSPAGV